MLWCITRRPCWSWGAQVHSECSSLAKESFSKLHICSSLDINKNNQKPNSFTIESQTPRCSWKSGVPAGPYQHNASYCGGLAQSTKINTHWVPSGITMHWYVLITLTKSATDLNFHGAADKPVRKNNILWSSTEPLVPLDWQFSGRYICVIRSSGSTSHNDLIVCKSQLSGKWLTCLTVASLNRGASLSSASFFLCAALPPPH